MRTLYRSQTRPSPGSRRVVQGQRPRAAHHQRDAIELKPGVDGGIRTGAGTSITDIRARCGRRADRRSNVVQNHEAGR